MEDNDNSSNLSNRFHDNDDQNRIVQQLQRTNISSKRKELFWYDIRNFPDSLLIEIVARLPVKSIFMFKSVCKHWQSLISHPSFSRFYHSILNSNSNASLPFRILHRYTHVPNFKWFVNRLAPEIHSSSEFSVLFLSTPEEQGPYEQFRILDMSNGLILCCWRSPTPFGVYYICDPLTRLWFTIPRRGPEHHDLFCEGLITRVNEDHMLTGYTVVRAEILDSRSNCLKLNIDMFSSEKGEWITYELSCVTPIELRDLAGGPIHCYGALHWPVYLHEKYRTHGMVAFDPYKDPKSVRLIPLPEDRDLYSEYHHDGAYQLCGESQGTLRYLEVADDLNDFYFLIMWAMKDYEKGEWCCEFKVRRSDLYSSHLELSNRLLDGSFSPLSFHPSNPNVVYLLSNAQPECVVSYNVLNRRLDVVSYNVLNERLDVACEESLDVACEESPDVAREEFLYDASEEWHFSHFISSGSVIPFVLSRWPVLVSVATVNSKIEGVTCRK